MKKITFRAECYIDITAFYQLFMYNEIPFDKLPNAIGKITIDPTTLISSFWVSDEIEIDFFKNISSNIADNHRICQTIKFGNTPNENWLEATFNKQYDVKTFVCVDDIIKKN